MVNDSEVALRPARKENNMPVITLPSHKTLELPKSPDHNPYVVRNPCLGKG